MVLLEHADVHCFLRWSIFRQEIWRSLRDHVGGPWGQSLLLSSLVAPRVYSQSAKQLLTRRLSIGICGVCLHCSTRRILLYSELEPFISSLALPRSQDGTY